MPSATLGVPTPSGSCCPALLPVQHRGSLHSKCKCSSGVPHCVLTRMCLLQSQVPLRPPLSHQPAPQLQCSVQQYRAPLQELPSLQVMAETLSSRSNVSHQVPHNFTFPWFPLQPQEFHPQLQCQVQPSQAQLCQAPWVQLCHQVQLHEPQYALCWRCCCQGWCLALELDPSGLTHCCAGVPVTSSAAPTTPSPASGTLVPSSTAAAPATAGESGRADTSALDSRAPCSLAAV